MARPPVSLWTCNGSDIVKLLCESHPNLKIEKRVRKARQGCSGCMKTVWDYCRKCLRGDLLMRGYGNRGLADRIAEDHAEEKVLRYVLDKKGSYDPDQPLAAYLRYIARDAWADYWRKRARELFEASTAESRLRRLLKTRRHIEKFVENNGLDRHEAEIIARTYRLGQSAAEIAEVLRINKSHVYAINSKFRSETLVQFVEDTLGDVFLPEEKQMVADFKTQYFAALRRDMKKERHGNNNRRVIHIQDRLADLSRLKAYECDPQELIERFRNLLQKEAWNRSDALKTLHAELLADLRDDQSWIPAELQWHGVPQAGITVYLRFWKDQKPATVKRFVAVSRRGRTQFEEMIYCLQRIRQVEDIGNEYIENLPFPVRELLAAYPKPPARDL